MLLKFYFYVIYFIPFEFAITALHIEKFIVFATQKPFLFCLFFSLSNIILSLKLNKDLKKRKKMEKEKSQNKLRIK